MPAVWRGARSAVVAYAAARVVGAIPQPRSAGWRRLNYRGREVSLSTGRSAVAGLLAGVATSPAGLVAVTASAAAGAYDDLRAPEVETTSDKGMRGHYRALRDRRLSGGLIKVTVIGGGSVVSALLMPGERSIRATATRAAVIASTANLVNLFDLRPGRAAKVAVALALTGLASSDPLSASASGATVATVLATIREDLDETGMLGDLGANALGAAVGLRLAAAPGRLPLIALATTAALTLASERISFSEVIESSRALRWLDRLGRR